MIGWSFVIVTIMCMFLMLVLATTGNAGIPQEKPQEKPKTNDK